MIMDTSVREKKVFLRKNYRKKRKKSVFCPFFVFYHPIMDQFLPIFSKDELQDTCFDKWVPDDQVVVKDSKKKP